MRKADFLLVLSDRIIAAFVVAVNLVAFLVHRYALGLGLAESQTFWYLLHNAISGIDTIGIAYFGLFRGYLWVFMLFCTLMYVWEADPQGYLMQVMIFAIVVIFGKYVTLVKTWGDYMKAFLPKKN